MEKSLANYLKLVSDDIKTSKGYTKGVVSLSHIKSFSIRTPFIVNYSIFRSAFANLLKSID